MNGVNSDVSEMAEGKNIPCFADLYPFPKHEGIVHIGISEIIIPDKPSYQPDIPFGQQNLVGRTDDS